MTEIVLATSNPHKIEEMNAIFAALLPGGVRFLSLTQVCRGVKLEEPLETGSTFEENATIKALSYAEQTGRVCLADDSGLEINALGGRPGVISSHYCTGGRESGMFRAERDEQNTARVLRELAGVPDERRGARFVCVMVVGAPRGPGFEPDPSRVVGGVPPPTPGVPQVLTHSRGTLEGRIAHVSRGVGGFGYDPVFLVAPDFLRSSAELTPAEKNRVSHRGAAAAVLAKALRELGFA